LKLIDTNVFIYAAGKPHEFKASCIRVLNLYAAGEIDLNIDTEVIQEVMYNLWNRRRFQEAVAMTDQLLAGFPTPYPITGETMRRARDVFASSPEIGPRDSVHAAVVLENDLEGIISTNGDFKSIPGVTRFDPKDF
jgi:predicted nucleic acid-binding protein